MGLPNTGRSSAGQANLIFDTGAIKTNQADNQVSSTSGIDPGTMDQEQRQEGTLLLIDTGNQQKTSPFIPTQAIVLPYSGGVTDVNYVKAKTARPVTIFNLEPMVGPVIHTFTIPPAWANIPFADNELRPGLDYGDSLRLYYWDPNTRSTYFVVTPQVCYTPSS